MRTLGPTPLLLLLANLVSAQEAEPPPAATTREVVVPLHDGVVQTDELIRALAAAFEIDTSDLSVPAMSLDLHGLQGSLVLLGARKLLLDTVRFERDVGGGRLVATIDRARARDLQRDLRAGMARFAGRLAGQNVAERTYELALPPQVDPDRPLVVLVHGLESGPETLGELRDYLQAPPRRAQVATFAYPDDEAIDVIATAFAAKLHALGAQPIAIVAHSMGGLVARRAIEDTALDPGNVRTLILLGTPNHGSDLAGLRIALELGQALGDVDDASHFARQLLDTCVARWRDGLGEAGGDLTPGSVFLTQLAARPRNPKATYHLVLGTHAPVRKPQLALVRGEVRARLDRNELGRIVRPHVEHWLEGLDEVVDGQGDGAVGVASGKLDGVEAVLVPRDHLGLVRTRGLLGQTVVPEQHPVFVQVARWLAEDARPR